MIAALFPVPENWPKYLKRIRRFWPNPLIVQVIACKMRCERGGSLTVIAGSFN